MKINELIYFCNEFDMLEAHLVEHAPFINKTFIVESETTVSGLEKPLFFKENKERFSKYNIEYIQAPPEPKRSKGWSDFRIIDHNKNLYAHPLACDDADYVMHSDCDEILYPAEHKISLETLDANRDWKFGCYKLRQSKTFVNCVQKKVNVYRYVKADTKGYLLSPKGSPRGGTVEGPAGWHMHNCFSTFDEFYWKMLNRNWLFTSPVTREECEYFYSRRGELWKITEKDFPKVKEFFAVMCDEPEAMKKRKQPLEYLPQWMQQNIDRFPYYDL